MALTTSHSRLQKSTQWRRGFLGVAALLGISLVTPQLISSSASAADVSGASMPTTAPSGMHEVFTDDFNGTSLDNQWFAYGGVGKDPEDSWSKSDVNVANGELTLSATATPGASKPWASGGVSSSQSFTDSEYGAYFVRMKAQAAEGISDVAMLWPVANSEPGELDFAEDGGGAKTEVSGSIHYVDPQGSLEALHSKMAADLTQWHTWGVVVKPNQLTYYLDGNVWATQTSNDIPQMARSFAIQTQAWPCGYAYETCPNSSTPATTSLQIDWVVADSFDEAPAAVAVPAVDSVSPSSGSQAGGTTVTLHGSGFTGTTSVDFGSIPATSFSVVSDNEITAVAPARAPGSADVQVTTPDGTIPASSSDEYNYLPLGDITQVSPDSGTQAGGTTVTLTGSGFTGASAVDFGTIPAKSFKVVSDTEITAVSPADSAGTRDIYVDTPNGTSQKRIADKYTYAGPAITEVSPDSGTQAGGTKVTVTGSDFSGASAVDFGSVPAASFKVVSDTEITLVTPAGSAATRDIYITTPDGTSQKRIADRYTYAGPAVTGVSPGTGTQAGGTTVTVTGSDFTGATKVDFGTVPAESFKVVSDTEITAVTPAEKAGEADIFVTNSDGTSRKMPIDTYTYGGPAVRQVSPSSGTQAGGTTVTLTGSGFTGATAVDFDTVPAVSFKVVSDTEITAVAPASSAATDDMYVTTPDGTSIKLPVDKYTYAGPAISGVSPSSGTQAGGTTVTVTGSDFTGTTQVLFGSVPATSFTVVSDTEIRAVAPAQSSSTRDIYVTNGDGTSVKLMVDKYTYSD